MRVLRVQAAMVSTWLLVGGLAQADPTGPTGQIELPEPQLGGGFLRTLGRDFAPLGRDFAGFVERDNLLLLGVAAGASLAGTQVDDAAVNGLNGSATADGVFEAGEIAGTWYALGGSALALYGYGRATGHDGPGDLGRDLIRSQIVSSTVTHALKRVSGRARPDGRPGSFPSGHTSGAFAFATVLQRHHGWKLGAPAFVAAGYIGASRLQENRHYLSDVVFGAAIGIAAGRAIRLGDREIGVAPLTTHRGGVGIQFSLRAQR